MSDPQASPESATPPPDAPRPGLVRRLLRVLRDDGSADPATDPRLPAEECVRLHRRMLFLRQFDQKMLGLQRQGRIAFYGASLGQEASVVGSACCAEPDDWVFPALREGGAALCVADTGEEGDAPLVSTADWGYLRLRRVEYGEDDLRAWADRIRQQGWNEAYVFFKHEDEATGPKLAARFMEILG